MLRELYMLRSDVCIAVAAEFVAMTFFQVLGGSAVEYAAFANGIVLAVLIFITAPLSAGHVNPNVTASLVMSGHFEVLTGCFYVVAQIAGAIAGAALQLAIIPNGNAVLLGCFGEMNGTNRGALIVWEAIGSALLLLTAHSVCVWRASFGSSGPAVIGASLTAFALTGGRWTGGALNPSRVLGPAVVNGKRCNWGIVGFYLIGQLIAVLLVSGVSVVVNGIGPTWKRSDERLEEQRPMLVKGSMSPGVMSSAAPRQNESRFAPTLTTTPEVGTPTMLTRYINDDSHA